MTERPSLLAGERLLVDLASERLGGAALLANDEFFAAKENLLKTEPPEFRAGVYTEQGKWMDGWETRRRREPGHDWCLIRMGAPGRIRKAVIDTTHFRGNHPEACSLEALSVEDPGELDPQVLATRDDWREILPRSQLAGDTTNKFSIDADLRVTHALLRIFPDGGVARLRLRGRVSPNWRRLAGVDGPVDLAALLNGGLPIACSDAFFGEPQNLLLPGPATHMGEGWETRRRRGPGHDWVIVRLGHRGTVERVEVDTSHFKGNYPESCSLEAFDTGEAEVEEAALVGDGGDWKPLIPRTALDPDLRHRFDVDSSGPATHLRLRIYPDGGVARLRVFGRPELES